MKKKAFQRSVIRIICIAVRWLLYPKSKFRQKVVGDGAECNWDRIVDALSFVRYLNDASCRLLKQVAILFLEAANLIHVNGLELALGLLLIGGKLLFSYRFETNSGIVADSNNENAAALAVAVVVVLVRKGDVNFRYIIGRVGRRVGVLQHRLAVAANDNDTGATVVFGLNGEAVLEHGLLAGFVVGRQRFVAKLLHATGAAEEVEGGNENDGDKGEDEDGDDGVDHPIGAIFGAGASGDESTEGLQARPLVAINNDRAKPQSRLGSLGATCGKVVETDGWFHKGWCHDWSRRYRDEMCSTL